MQTLFHPPQAAAIATITPGAWGSRVEYPDDIAVHGIQPGQRWLPHAVDIAPTTFNTGEMVHPSDWIRKNTGMSSVVFVEKTRFFQYYRNEIPADQVQILGYPCQWFHANHFTLD